MKPTYKIEDWLVAGNCLYGYVQRYEGNSPRNGIRTSRIIAYDGDNLIETLNSIYELGTIHDGCDRQEMLGEGISKYE